MKRIKPINAEEKSESMTYEDAIMFVSHESELKVAA